MDSCECTYMANKRNACVRLKAMQIKCLVSHPLAWVSIKLTEVTFDIQNSTE